MMKRKRKRRSPPSVAPDGSTSWRVIIIAAAVAIALVLLFKNIDIDEVHAWAARLHGGLAFGLLTVLPLVGFPVSILQVAAGVRFGVGFGMLVVPLSILLHLLISYLLVHVFRDRFSRRLTRLRRRIPSGAHASVCVFTMVLPGAPYFAQNYVLPLIGVPLRTYLLICFPLHVVRSSIAVAFGDQSDHLTPGRLTLLGLYWLSLLTLSIWTFRRLRVQLSEQSNLQLREAQAA